MNSNTKSMSLHDLIFLQLNDILRLIIMIKLQKNASSSNKEISFMSKTTCIVYITFLFIRSCLKREEFFF